MVLEGEIARLFGGETFPTGAVLPPQGELFDLYNSSSGT